MLGNVISRPEQLPALGTIVGATSGIWAPAIRYHDGNFYVTTTLVFDNKAQNDSSRWYNVCLYHSTGQGRYVMSASRCRSCSKPRIHTLHLRGLMRFILISWDTTRHCSGTKTGTCISKAPILGKSSM